MSISYNLESILTELGITKNYLAVETKTRPATVLNIARGDIKRIDLETADTLLNELNSIAIEKGIAKVYSLNDIFTYKFER